VTFGTRRWFPDNTPCAAACLAPVGSVSTNEVDGLVAGGLEGEQDACKLPVGALESLPNCVSAIDTSEMGQPDNQPPVCIPPARTPEAVSIFLSVVMDGDIAASVGESECTVVTKRPMDTPEAMPKPAYAHADDAVANGAGNQRECLGGKIAHVPPDAMPTVDGTRYDGEMPTSDFNVATNADDAEVPVHLWC
jgi:hypothetical protein